LRAAAGGAGHRAAVQHQAKAFDALAAGRNVVVVTPTASGKTLCYNLPVLNRLIAEPDARAMTCSQPRRWPRTRCTELQQAVDRMGSGIRAFTYDGDTRRKTRARPSASAPTSC